jgi:hypothetical protein
VGPGKVGAGLVMQRGTKQFAAGALLWIPPVGAGTRPLSLARGGPSPRLRPSVCRGHACAVRGEQIGHAGGQGAAAAGVEVGRLTDQDVLSVARGARCRGLQGCSVAGVAHRTSRPEDLDLRDVPAQGACALRTRPARGVGRGIPHRHDAKPSGGGVERRGHQPVDPVLHRVRDSRVPPLSTDNRRCRSP